MSSLNKDGTGKTVLNACLVLQGNGLPDGLIALANVK